MKLATLSLCVLPFVFACAAETGGPPQASKRDAGNLLATASKLIESIDTDAAVKGALPATQATVDFSHACPTSGSIELDGTFEASADGLTSEFDVDAGFRACTVDAERLDGSLRWIAILDGGVYRSTLSGTLAWQGAAGLVSCTVDLQIEDDRSTGTICGYSVDDIDE